MAYISHQAAEILGISVQTLHYYEKEQLIPTIKRDSANKRIYSENDLEWIRMIVLMRSIDTPVQEIRKYSRLLMQGPNTIEERYGIIKNYRQTLQARIEKMTFALIWLEEKEKFYHEMLETGTEYSTFQEESKAFRQRLGL